MKKLCAIYTRKSTDERLDMEFNSLDAQREACEAYIRSQKSEGWISSSDAYDDGGFSGGDMDRPALKQLMDDIRAGMVNVVVVYKIDRLTRSLMDFSKLVEVFDEYGVTFVSITQSFNTTTSMGRLTLNVLLSFAQFEREVTGERIRDKIAASKRRGMWMGGTPPIGYNIENRQLVINSGEVHLARHLFDRYLVLGSVRALKIELDREGIKTPVRTSLKGKTYGGQPFARGALYHTLKNPAYIGKIRHKDVVHEGMHEGIVPLELWERVQAQLTEQAVLVTNRTEERHVLQGLLRDSEGVLYGPTFTSRHNRQYRYYISQNLRQYRDHPKGLLARLPAQEIETAVETALIEQATKLCRDNSDAIGNHVLKHLGTVPTHDLIRESVAGVVIDTDRLTITIDPSGFARTVQKHLNIRLECLDDCYDIHIPYLTARARRGAVVIKVTAPSKDLFDASPEMLKKLIQGVVWRDEHFAGALLKDIAEREGYSQGYVGNTIFSSFKILQKAFPVTA